MKIQSFLYDPKKKMEFTESKIGVFLIALFICYFLVFFSSFIVSSIVNSLEVIPSKKSWDGKLLEQENGLLIALSLVLIIGPLIEELIFRLPMNGKIKAYSVSASVLTFILSYPLRKIENLQETWVELIVSSLISLIVLVVTYFVLKHFESSLKRLSRNGVIYSLTILFAIFHIYNFENLRFEYTPIYLIMVLPQLIMGFHLAFIRINFGFLSGVLFHLLINTPSGLILLFKNIN